MATLLLTVPRSVFKSSAKDLSSPISQIMIRRVLDERFRCLDIPSIYDSGLIETSLSLLNSTWRG